MGSRLWSLGNAASEDSSCIFERESESRDEANVDQNVEDNLQFWKRDTVIQVPCSHVSCKTDKQDVLRARPQIFNKETLRDSSPAEAPLSTVNTSTVSKDVPLGTPPALSPEQSDVVRPVKSKSRGVCFSGSYLEQMHDGEVNSLAAVPLAASEANAVHEANMIPEFDSLALCSVVSSRGKPPVLSPKQSDVVMLVNSRSLGVCPSVSHIAVHNGEVNSLNVVPWNESKAVQILKVSDTDFSAYQCFEERGFATSWRQDAAVCVVGWFSSPKFDRSKWESFVQSVKSHKPFWVLTRSTRCSLTPADLRPLFDLPHVTQTDVDLCEYGFAARESCKVLTNMPELRGLRGRCTPERPHQQSRADHARATCSWPVAWMDMFVMLTARACGLPPKACRRPLAEVQVLQACHVYVGRGSRHRKLEASEWSNPFRIAGETTRTECVDKFLQHLKKSPELLKKLHTLRGFTLLCHCPRHLRCHADVLCAMANDERGVAVETQNERILFSRFFDMVATDRKRPLGQAVQATVVRAAAGRWAAAARTQLKRTTMPPIIQHELEPGDAVKLLTNIAHPFNVAPRLDDNLQEALFSAAGMCKQ